MGIPRILRISAILLVVLSPSLLQAQFQPPTADELKMTADPKAPGAAAVYLYREETTDDTLHFHSYYERIKVLTEKGKELATQRIPYERGPFKVSDIHGRTIHADGTIIPMTGKPEDLVDEKSRSYQINMMVFTLPSVEVGSILEFRLEIRYDDNIVSSPEWNIQQPYFVHKAHYMFKPARESDSRYLTDSRGQVLDQRMHGVMALPLEAVKENIGNYYTVDLTDIPPIPDEDWMPPLNTIKQRVKFYYTYVNSEKDFWEREGKRWAKDTERFTNPKDAVKKTVAEIVSPSDTEELKARKIYDAVMKLDNTDFSRKKSAAERKAEKIKEIKNAEDVWKQKSGTGDEITLLYVALARASGLKVWPMLVVDRNRAIFDPSLLYFDQLDDYVVVVELSGKEIYLDPGQKMCPFGLLHWRHTIAGGLRLKDKGAEFGTTPPSTYTTAIMKRVGELQLDTDGNIKGTVKIAMIGPDALRWRQLALENDTDEVQKRFNEFVRGMVPDGVQADIDHCDGLTDPNANLICTVKISGNLGTVTGKRAFLPGLFFESHAKHPFVAQEKRSTPIDVHFAQMIQDDLIYRLPVGFTVESAPQTAELSWPDHALLKIHSTIKGNNVEVARVFAHNYTLLDPKEYNDLHGFYQKVATADQQSVVVTRPQTAKGD